MKKKNFFMILFFVISFSIFFDVKKVNAELLINNNEYMIQKLATSSTARITSVNVQGDIATVKSSGSVLGYYVGMSNSLSSSSTYYSKVVSNTFYASVKNGTYYFWVASSPTGRAIIYGPVKVTSSCSNQSITGATGTGTVERCYKTVNNNNTPDQTGNVVTCASGYVLSDFKTKQNNCYPNTNMKYGTQTLPYRYCKVIYSYTCKKNTGSSSGGSGNSSSGGGVTAKAATLSGLSVSGASLTPKFSSGTKNYSTSVGSGVSSVRINATASSGSSFVSGYGPRNVNLSYGQNKFSVRVRNSAGAVTIYNITINRADGRSNVNTLSSLTVNSGSLSPIFNPNTYAYSVNVDNNVSSINIGATLTDGKSTFVSGYGPRTVNLDLGLNSVLIKTRSESGKTNVYTLNIMRRTEDPVCTSEADNLALLKQIKLSADIEDVKLKQIDFAKKKFSYTNVKIPYEVANLQISVATQDEGDTYEISDANNLEVNIEKTITITVTSKKCPSVKKVYTLIVTRQEKHTASSNAEIDTLTIKNHDEFQFEQNTTEYDIKLKKGEKSLGIVYTTEDKNTNCRIEDNENLEYGSVVTLTCVAEDESTESVYKFNIVGVEKGTNVFLLIIVVILIILVLIYLVLRLLGYKVFINFAVIGAFFRGIGEKIKNIFDR